MTRNKETYSFTNILAKPNETLSVHTSNAILSLKQCLNWHSRSISYVCDLLGIEPQELVARFFAMVYLHDIGKSSYSFQKHIRSVEKRSKAFPHALLSLPFVIASIPHLKIGTCEEYLEALAVMSHHTPFYDDLYAKQYLDADPETQFNADVDCKRYALRFYEYLPEYYRLNFHTEYPFKLLRPDLVSKFKKILDQIKREVRREDRPRELRHVHSLFVSILHYSDWLASGNLVYRFSEDHITPRLDLYVKQNSSFKNWYDIQKEAAQVRGNLILSAPTGKGKTEAALLWSESNLHAGKILYLLPTRVTVNAMYTRLREILGNTTGISHGTSVLKVAEDEKWDKSNIMTKRILFGTFMSPTTVATVDQLSLSQFNWRHWEMVEQNASNAAIIFDEIHAYDFYSLALITEVLRVLATRGSRFAFLSATLPSYVKEHISRCLNNNVKTVYDKEFLSLKRHSIDFLNQHIQNAIIPIITEYNKGRKVLVILNTVDSAIDFYRLIKTDSGLQDSNALLLYHSRFIEKHRAKKEDHIKRAVNSTKGFIAVTTQVVEVSLDIDYDILFTQLAPLDALVQRFGRVNRNGLKPVDKPNVLIYLNEKNDALVYGEVNLTVAKDIVRENLTGKTPSEQDISQLIDKQYPKFETLELFKKEWQNVREDLRFLQRELWDIQTLLLGEREDVLYKIARTRKDEIVTVDVIPEQYREEVESLESMFKLKAISFLVKLPYYKFHQCIRFKDADTQWTYADVEYNEDEGAIACKK